MQSINKAYLADIITRAMNETIRIRRASQKTHFYYLYNASVQAEEVLDFIQSIPYFDEGLKNFLTTGKADAAIIVSQTWETAFIVKCKAWANSKDWLHKDTILTIGFYPQYIPMVKDALTLPY